MYADKHDEESNMSAMWVPEKLSILSGLFIYAGNFKSLATYFFLMCVMFCFIKFYVDDFTDLAGFGK